MANVGDRVVIEGEVVQRVHTGGEDYVLAVAVGKARDAGKPGGIVTVLERHAAPVKAAKPSKKAA